MVHFNEIRAFLVAWLAWSLSFVKAINPYLQFFFLFLSLILVVYRIKVEREKLRKEREKRISELKNNLKDEQ
jgi:hypothetical protein